jgi:uncharacterized protein
MLKKLSVGVLLATALITAVLGYYASKSKFDYNFESFFPKGDTDLEFFLKFREKFENDNDFILIGIDNQGSIFEKDFLSKINALTNDLKSAEHIVSVASLTNLKFPVVSAVGMMEVPYLHWNSPEKYTDDSLRIYSDPNLPGAFISKDGHSMALFVKTIENPSKVKSDSIALSVERILARYDFPRNYVVGKVLIQKVYLEMMQREFVVFFLASFVLLVIFLLVAFRSLWGVFFPIVLVFLSIIWLLGIMQLSGKMLDLMSTLIPTILFVVGMSDVVHLVSRYFEELRSGKEKNEALKITVKEVGPATFLTSLTTAVGFLTLMSSNILPIKEFGFYLAIGVFIAFFLTYSFFIAVLFLLKKPKAAKDEGISVFRNRILSDSFLKILLFRKQIVIGLFAILAVSVIGLTRIHSNVFVLDDITDEVPLKKSLNYFDKNFAGARTFELYAELKDSTKSIFEPSVLSEIEKVEAYLTTEYGVGNLMSPVKIVKTANKAISGGSAEAFKIPDKQKFSELKDKLLRIKKRKEFKAIVSADGKSARISGRLPDLGSMVYAEKDEKLKDFLSQINSAQLNYRLTGNSFMLDRSNDLLSVNMLSGLSIAFLLIAAIAGIMFKSFKMPLIALIPNVLPLLMIAGIMGFTGIGLKVSTSIVFTIAFGIAVDDTIHFLSKFRMEINKGRSALYALKRTFLSTGKAIVVTTLILCAGFLTLIFSEFQSTFYVGVMISLALFFALFADLLILPPLLLWVYRKAGSKK